MKILVTRPEPDATQLAERLHEMGHEAVVEPLMRTTYCHHAPLPVQNVQGVIATSRNGLRALMENASLGELSKLPLFAVGSRTGQLAENAGFTRIYEANGSALELAKVIKKEARPDGGTLLHLAGDKLAVDLCGVLEELGFDVEAPVVYDMEPACAFEAQTIDMIQKGEIDAVILLSPRTAKIFRKLARTHHLEGSLARMKFFCLSKSIAKALDLDKKMDLRVADKTELEEVLKLVNLEAAQLS